MTGSSIGQADARPDRSVAYLLRDCSNAWSLAIEALLRGESLRYFEWMILELISEGRLTTPGALAREVSLNAGTITRLTVGLSELGLITRNYGSEDRRVVSLKITAKGEKLVLRLAPKVRRLRKGFLGRFSLGETEQLAQLLRKLKTTIAASAE